jgi:hypothetical protein
MNIPIRDIVKTLSEIYPDNFTKDSLLEKDQVKKLTDRLAISEMAYLIDESKFSNKADEETQYSLSEALAEAEKILEERYFKKKDKINPTLNYKGFEFDLKFIVRAYFPYLNIEKWIKESQRLRYLVLGTFERNYSFTKQVAELSTYLIRPLQFYIYPNNDDEVISTFSIKM